LCYGYGRIISWKTFSLLHLWSGSEFVTLFNLDILMYAFYIYRDSYVVSKQISPNSEKWYFKGVSEDEKIKIEWDDKIEEFTRQFLITDYAEFRNQKEQQINPSLY
jgi:hypothetical protein